MPPRRRVGSRKREVASEGIGDAAVAAPAQMGAFPTRRANVINPAIASGACPESPLSCRPAVWVKWSASTPTALVAVKYENVSIALAHLGDLCLIFAAAWGHLIQ